MATNTTNSFTNHTGNNTAGPFSISFDYLAESEVVVTVGGVVKTQTTHYTFPSATTISFTSGNHPANSAVIKFQRNTSVSSKKVDFQDGSVLTEADLDNNSNQLLYSFQEFLDEGQITEADLLDEDNMASNSATKAATQQSIKAYVDASSGVTNLSYTAGTREIASSSGTNVTLPEATTSNAGLQSSSDKTKLDGLSDITSGGTIDGDLTLTGANYNAVWDKSDNAFEFADNTKLTFGNSNDLEIYHSSSNNASYIVENGASALVIKAENFDVQDTSGNSYLLGVHDGALQMYHHGDARLLTTSTGITVYSGASGSEAATGAITSGNIGVTGNITVSGTVDGRDLQTDGTKLDGIAASANNYSISSDLLDEDNMASNSATKAASQQSIKAYVDANSGGGGTTNLSATANGTSLTVESSSGNNVSLPAATTSAWGVMSDDDKTKLDGIASNANVGLTDLVGDTTPQLGGNLDVNSQDIVSTSNGDIDLDPNGSGKVVFKGNATKGSGQFKLNCENNSHGIVIKGPPHSAAASYTLTLPNTDGSANQVLKTDGSGNLDWVAQTTDTNTQLSNAEVRTAVEAASDSNVFTDADHTKLNAIAASANNYVHPNHSGEVTSTADGATVIADNIVDEANLKVSNAPTNGYFLQAQSGNTGGLTWAAASGGSSNLNINTTSKTVYGGTDAGENLTDSANENVFLGYKAGNTTYGDYNVAIGSEAFEGAGTHTANTVSIGYKAMGSNAGGNNTAVGYEALKVCGGTNSTALGYQALVACTAAQCVSVGAFAGKSTTSGENITAIGFNSGPNNTSGTNNTYCGRESGQNITTGSNNLCLGYQSNASAVDVSNEITLGNASVTKLRVPGLNSFEINDSGQFSGVASTASGTAGVRKITASTSSPSGGADGDIWIKYTA